MNVGKSLIKLFTVICNLSKNSKIMTQLILENLSLNLFLNFLKKNSIPNFFKHCKHFWAAPLPPTCFYNTKTLPWILFEVKARLANTLTTAGTFIYEYELINSVHPEIEPNDPLIFRNDISPAVTF